MPVSRFYPSQGLKLHYLDWGNDGAPLLVMVHGGRDHCRNWDRTAEALRRDWRVIAVDLRGHGDSQWSPDHNYFMLALAQDLADLIEHLGAPQITLIGHSRGGQVVLRYAGIYPERVRKLVAIEGLGRTTKLREDAPASTVGERVREFIKAARRIGAEPRKRYPSLEACLERMREAHKRLSEGQLRHLTEHAVIRDPDGAYRWKFDPMVGVFPPYDMSGDEIRNLWGCITCPVLHINGTESNRLAPDIDGKIRFFQDARSVTIFGASHWVHHDRFDAFIEAVRGFI